MLKIFFDDIQYDISVLNANNYASMVFFERPTKTLKVTTVIIMLLLFSTVITLSSLSLLASKEFFINKFLSSEWSVKPLNIDQYSSSSSSIQFRIALFPTNTDKLQQAVHSIADPKSKDYRRYLSNEDITSIVQPSEDDLSKLFNWVSK
jgi:subtilase family serine protease